MQKNVWEDETTFLFKALIKKNAVEVMQCTSGVHGQLLNLGAHAQKGLQ